jgi:hypothetical protein
MNNLILSVLAAMISLVPRSGWLASYPETAAAFVAAAEASPFMGVDGPDVPLTAAILVAWAERESRFQPDAKGDSGASLGVLEVNPDYASRLLSRPVSDMRAELMDPATAAPIWLAAAHESFRFCARHPVDERLAQLAWGRDCDHRLDLSRSRIKTARALVAAFF